MRRLARRARRWGPLIGHRLLAGGRVVGRTLRLIDGRDICAVAGYGLLVTGLARLSVELALVVAGVVLLVVAVWPALRSLRRRES